MSAKLLLSPLAVRDLGEIWDFSADRWGMARADRYLALLNKTMEGAAKHPSRGRGCGEIRKGYFKMQAGSHIVFYKRVAGGIDVKRILHQSMDFDRHL